MEWISDEENNVLLMLNQCRLPEWKHDDYFTLVSPSDGEYDDQHSMTPVRALSHQGKKCENNFGLSEVIK